MNAPDRLPSRALPGALGGARSSNDASGLPPACVHVDLDGWWAVRRCYDDTAAGPEDPDPVYDEGLPALGELFARLDMPATFFAVGADAAVESKAARLRELASIGSVENHSFSHPLGLGALDDEEFEGEVRRAHEAIAAATGLAPTGFRAPGYDFDRRRLPPLLRALGYRYDSSMLPTWAGPMLRLTDAWIRGARPKSRQYGPWKRVLGRRNPFVLPGPPGAPPLWELPVAVSSPWRLPIQAGVCLVRGTGALRATLRRLRNSSDPVIFLLHGIDAVDTSGPRALVAGPRGRRFFDYSKGAKMALLEDIFRLIRETRTVVATESLACF